MIIGKITHNTNRPGDQMAQFVLVERVQWGKLDGRYLGGLICRLPGSFIHLNVRVGIA